MYWKYETRLVEITWAKNENKQICNSCTMYIALFSIFFTINVGIGKKMLFVLSLVPTLKQQFNELINGKLKQIEIKNWTYYFYNDIINLKNFESNLLKINKNHDEGIDIYYIWYIAIKKIGDCENFHTVNPLLLLINQPSGYIEETNGSKCLIFDDSANENKELLKQFADVCDGIKNEIKTINGGKENDYGKDYMKIKFNSDYDLPLNKPLKFHAMTIIIRSAFEESGKLYPQIFLDNSLYEL